MKAEISTTRTDGRRAGRGEGSAPWLLAGVGLCALVFLAAPIAAMLIGGADGLIDVFRRSGSLQAMRLSLVVSLCAVMSSLLLGFPLAWWMSGLSRRTALFVRTVVLLPMVMPPVVAGLALLRIFSRGGWLGMFGVDLAFTVPGAILAATFVSMPFFVIAAEAGLHGRDVGPEESAATLGASRWRILQCITIPAIRPALLAGIGLTWARALGEFGATITFNGSMPGRTQTMPLAIYTLHLSGNESAALAMGSMLLAVSAIMLFILRSRWGAR